MIKNPAFYFNAELCTGCKTCIIACKDKNNLPVGIQWRRVLEYSGGEWEDSGGVFEQNVWAYYVSVACNHCDEPPCVNVCPFKALTKSKKTGLVTVDHKKCQGCRLCEKTCPYGSPQFNPEIKKMTKCDFCQELLAEDKAPICVESCTCRALDFGEYEALLEKYKSPQSIAPLPAVTLTKPHLFINPHRNAKPDGYRDGFLGEKISNPEEVNQPY